MSTVTTVAVIASFKQHYGSVLEALKEFRGAGWTVTSPLGDHIIEPGVDFVRFTSDREDWSSDRVQTVALHRILRADLTYVVAPGGYVGRTTCYEIGRVLQARRPLYFSDAPHDLPLLVPPTHIVAPAALVELLQDFPPSPLYEGDAGEQAQWEERLVAGDYLDL